MSNTHYSGGWVSNFQNCTSSWEGGTGEQEKVGDALAEAHLWVTAQAAHAKGTGSGPDNKPRLACVNPLHVLC